MRYQATVFSQVFHETLYAVWDWLTRNYVIEANGMVAVNPDRKAVRTWAKYLNNNLPYESPLTDKPFSKIQGTGPGARLPFGWR